MGQDTITELLPCQWELNGVGEGVVLMCWVDLWDINTVGQGRIRKFMQYQNSKIAGKVRIYIPGPSMNSLFTATFPCRKKL